MGNEGLLLLGFSVLEWEGTKAATTAAQLYRKLRKKGVAVRKSNDCLIADFAHEFELQILHFDRDFTIMATQGIVKEVVMP